MSEVLAASFDEQLRVAENGAAGAGASEDVGSNSESDDDAVNIQDARAIERQQEEQLRLKYGNLHGPRGRGRGGGGGFLAQRRLQTGGRKYFDSGEYMAQQKKPPVKASGLAQTESENDQGSDNVKASDRQGNPDIATPDKIYKNRMALFANKNLTDEGEELTPSMVMALSALSKKPLLQSKWAKVPKASEVVRRSKSPPSEQQIKRRSIKKNVPSIPSKLI